MLIQAGCPIFIRPICAFSACTWDLTGPSEGTDENGGAYVSFNLTLRSAPSGFDFAQDNISFRCTFYENQTSQQPYGLYSYTVGPEQMEMNLYVSNWAWNTNYMSSLFTSMHRDYGVTVPSQTGSLALWCDLTSLNMQDLGKALNDADEPLTSVPENSALAPTGLLESSSTLTDVIAGGHQIHMQNMPESVTDDLSVPTGGAAPYRMQFAEGDKTLPGFFDFVNHAAVFNETTPDAYSEYAAASYRTASNYMQLFICYPYFGANTLEHGPSIGIDTNAELIPENLPVILVIIIATVIAIATAKTSHKLKKTVSEKKHQNIGLQLLKMSQGDRRLHRGYSGFYKPITYKTKSMLQERIAAKMIFYEKLKDGIRVEFDF